jgi:C-terminal processing protease CtpA/Prc
MNARRLLAHHLILTALLLTLCAASPAQSPGRTLPLTSTQDARIARLAGLAKVWGAVKYFHPFLAYREIDWDMALVQTIPKVSTAHAPQEYQAALNQMLSALGDDATRALIEVDSNPAPQDRQVASAKEPLRTDDGLLVIDATQMAKAVAQNNGALGGFIEKTGSAIQAAKAIVIDGRGNGQRDDLNSYFFGVLMRQILPQILDANLTLGSIRYRMHSGYASQTGGGAEFYYSGFVNVAPQVINGMNRAKTPPIVFIINESSPATTDLLSGLQSANLAFIVQEGEQAQDGGSFTLRLPDGVKVKIRADESLSPDGSVGFRADAVVPKSSGEDAALRVAMQAARENRRPRRSANAATITQQVSQKEKDYAEMEFPAAEYRLLALFRFWNVINYFYPYKSLIGDSWETVLPRYIPKFEANKEAADYQLTVRELVAEIHDSHGGVQNANASTERLGAFLPPVLVRYVENQSVVTKVLDDKLPVKVGDVILSVDGEPIEKRREFLSRFLAASTPQSLMRSVHANLLRGQKDSVAKLRVRGADGAVREVEIARSVSRTDRRFFAAAERSLPVVQVLPSGYGYVDLARLQADEVNKMFETIKGTHAVIFDMRGYPNGTAWTIAPRLTEKRMPVAALFSRPLLEATSLSDSDLEESADYTFAQRLPEREGEVYKGKVVMLINEDAISQAEHTCLFFEAATDVTFIGTPTTGANGDVTLTVLPGQLPITFTGQNVRHADGRQLQRVGIQPTIRVAPTIRGLIAGRDEILEAAVEYLQKNIKSSHLYGN